MSYVFAGYGAITSLKNDFEKSFVAVVPSEIRKDTLRIEGGNSFLVSYGANKVIKDVVIRSSEMGSWIALLGTPLVKFAKKEESAAFLERFFNDPKRTIKDEIDGCFAIISFDAASNTLLVATDYNNTTPIYYSETKNGICLSSHELALARFLQPEIDPSGFSMAIQLKVTWGSHTRFKDIHKLLPCQIMTFRGGRDISSERYWSPLDEAQWPANFDDVIDKWLAILKGSVRAFYDCSNNNKVICDFTAGEDSRLILSQCHALNIPFYAMVDGRDTDVDVIVSKEASRKTGFDLVIRAKHLITEEQLLNNATYISLMNDAYQDYFRSCTDYATDSAHSQKNYEYVKYGGAPGGEAYRGSYYWRGKAFFPSNQGSFDHIFFLKMKYLLDFHPGLLSFSDDECKKTIFRLAEESLKDVAAFPVGIRIDHLLRTFQTCNAGLIYKNPRYLPFATKNMTRSIYSIPPKFKKGGRLTKACTELLYPELAVVKTQKGVPTIRKTLARSFLFIPEHIAVIKGIMQGAVSRLYRWTDSNKPSYRWSENGPAITTLLTKPPYSDLFSSSKRMRTGYLYNQEVVDSLFADAKAGSSRYVPILGRIINQELACRWVYGDKF